MTVALLCGLVGAALGFFLVRPAYRLSVPEDGGMRAECENCDAPVAWLGLSRCDSCGHRLGPRWWLLVVVSAVVCAGIGWRFGLAWELVPYLLLGLVGVLLGGVDLACLRLPNVLVKPAFLGGALLLAALALAGDAWSSLLRAGIAAALLSGGYLILAVLPGAQLGWGDVKLAGVLGLFLGWLGWREVLVGAMLPFLLNGLVALVLLVMRRVDRKTLVPFGPAMLVGTWLAIIALPQLR
jgi:leader peptidase (prepilin peptidase)/N-methyltransferase